MDHSSLLYQISPLKSDRKISKYRALHYAWTKVLSLSKKLTFDQFLASVPTVVLNTQFGRNPDDVYLTSLLGAAGYFRPDVDCIYAALLNRIVLELNFQTRFLGSSPQAEAVVIDGEEVHFPFAMANGNVVAGVQIAAHSQDGPLPDWSELDHLDFQLHNLFARPLESVDTLLTEKGRTRIGCLAVTLPVSQDRELDFGERYKHLSEKISSDTMQIIRAPFEMGLCVLDEVRNNHPNARVESKVYADPQKDDIIIIAIVTGVSGPIQFKLDQKVVINSKFLTTQHKNSNVDLNPREIHYYTGPNGEKEEWVRPAPPVAVRSSSPLPIENRNSTSATSAGELHVPHLVYAFKGGKMAAIEGPNYSTHVYMNAEGDIMKDLSDPSGIEFSPVYTEATTDKQGQRTGTLVLDRRIRVKGRAMPLTFTPSLHTYHSHFLLQCFPRVKIFRELMPDGKFIVPSTLRKKQIEMLKLVGIDESQLVLLEPGTLIEADELFVPYAWTLMFSPFTLEIYKELADKIPNAPPLVRRALISREQRTTWRNMLTYEMVKSQLVERYGFEVIRPEKLTLAEEVNLYRNVEFMIGAEGAGLYSAVYSGPGSTYISIGDEDYIMPMMATAAAVRGFNLAYVFGDSMRTDFDVTRRKPYGHSDFVVDPDTVAQLLDELLSAKN